VNVAFSLIALEHMAQGVLSVDFCKYRKTRQI